MDDISSLRDYSTDQYKTEPELFKVKPAYWYFQKDAIYGQGDNQYAAKNPPFGANFTYYLPEKVQSLKSSDIMWIHAGVDLTAGDGGTTTGCGC